MVGVVEPTCRRAVLMTQNKRVGLIATAASVRSGAYEAALRRLDPEVTVFSRACPLFVPLAEAGRIRRGDVVFYEILAEELALRDMDGEPLTRENYGELMERIDAYLSEFDEHGTDNISVDLP